MSVQDEEKTPERLSRSGAFWLTIFNVALFAILAWVVAFASANPFLP